MSDSLIQLKMPSGKEHISFSEIRLWFNCPHKYKLKLVDKIVEFDKPSYHMDFGTAVHSGCENFLKTKTMDKTITENELREFWKISSYKEDLEENIQKANFILDEVPKFLDDNFEEWKTIDAEELLMEQIAGKDIKFKGFIDGVIEAKGKRRAKEVWLLDWKTTSWGWSLDKKTDDLNLAQLILYKVFWAQKHNVDLNDIRCGFILLKRDGKPGNRCELVKISAGPKAIEKATKKLDLMVKQAQKGLYLKNRESCKYCEFKETKYCP